MGQQTSPSDQTFHFFGGNGSLLHMAVGNGFPPQVYEAMLAPFFSSCQVFSALPRALWKPAPRPSSAPDWQTMADDLRAGLHRMGHQQVIGVGHSMGGVATMLAAADEPHLFRGIAMLDPVMLPPYVLWMIRLLRPFGVSMVPLSKKARNRRRLFNSVDEAFDYWRDKRAFRDWSDEVLRRYAEGLLVDDPSSQGVQLVWEPEWEAHYYDSIATHLWRTLRRLPKDLPVLVVRGGTSDTLFPSAVKQIKRTLPHVQVVELPGLGHLFPQARPQLTSEVLQTWMHEHGWIS